ncbi:MAG: tripartite tricarboxylate transporter substrate binding protein [Oscillospiraceae bacterium]
MKQIAGLLLSLLLICGIAGCSQNSETPSASDAQATPSSQAPEEQSSNTPDDVEWPDGTVTLYVATKAGNAADLYARVLTPVLQANTGKDFVVVNQPEGGGVVAYETVRNSKPDGSSLLYFLNTMIVQHYTGVYDVDPAEEFTPVAVMKNSGSMFLIVRSDSPYNSVEDIINDVKSNPGKVKFGMTSGQALHLVAGMMENDIGAQLNMVDAGGNNERLISLLGGNIDFTMVSPGAADQYTQSGEIKVLACVSSTGERDPLFPDIPNVTELGLPTTMYGFDILVLGPKDMDPALAEKINETFAEALDDSTVKDQYANMKFSLSILNLDDSKAYMKDFSDTIAPIAKSLGFGN